MESTLVKSPHRSLVDFVLKQHISHECDLKTEESKLQEQSDLRDISMRKPVKKNPHYRAIEIDYLKFRQDLFYSVLESNTTGSAKSAEVSIICQHPHCACFPFMCYFKRTKKTR